MVHQGEEVLVPGGKPDEPAQRDREPGGGTGGGGDGVGRECHVHVCTGDGALLGAVRDLVPEVSVGWGEAVVAGDDEAGVLPVLRGAGDGERGVVCDREEV